MRDGEKQAAVARAIVRRRADLAADARAFDAAMRLLRLTRIIPAEERHPLTDRIRRAPRSVCSNAVEARRERCHPPRLHRQTQRCRGRGRRDPGRDAVRRGLGVSAQEGGNGGIPGVQRDSRCARRHDRPCWRLDPEAR
ncbi:MAG: four helix bundle protein [Phycisphaerae bacterium]